MLTFADVQILDVTGPLEVFAMATQLLAMQGAQDPSYAIELVAEAGLLDGKRATTHWAYAERLAQRYPKVTVEPDPIFIRDGDVYTSQVSPPAWTSRWP
jgi:transcriptional regulator GlxA family with amidase domain